MSGKLIVITGPMFCGKTTELIREAKRQSIAKKKVQILNPTMDDRFSTENLLSHDKQFIETTRVTDSQDLKHKIHPDTEIVGIDELHFFDSGIIDVIEELSNQGKVVIITALNQNFLGQPFPFAIGSHRNMGEVLAKADEIRHLTAVCTYIKHDGEQCSEHATKTQRFVGGKPAPKTSENILVGAQESYAPRCRKHYVLAE